MASVLQSENSVAPDTTPTAHLTPRAPPRLSQIRQLLWQLPGLFSERIFRSDDLCSTSWAELICLSPGPWRDLTGGGDTPVLWLGYLECGDWIGDSCLATEAADFSH